MSSRSYKSEQREYLISCHVEPAGTDVCVYDWMTWGLLNIAGKKKVAKQRYRFPCETVDCVLPKALRHVYSVQVGPMQLYTQLTQSKVQKISIL